MSWQVRSNLFRRTGLAVTISSLPSRFYAVVKCARLGFWLWAAFGATLTLPQLGWASQPLYFEPCVSALSVHAPNFDNLPEPVQKQRILSDYDFVLPTFEPVEQCGGTCSFEAQFRLIKHEIQRTNPSAQVSRVGAFEMFAISRLRRLAYENPFDRSDILANAKIAEFSQLASKNGIPVLKAGSDRLRIKNDEEFLVGLTSGFSQSVYEYYQRFLGDNQTQFPLGLQSFEYLSRLEDRERELKQRYDWLPWRHKTVVIDLPAEFISSLPAKFIKPFSPQIINLDQFLIDKLSKETKPVYIVYSDAHSYDQQGVYNVPETDNGSEEHHAVLVVGYKLGPGRKYISHLLVQNSWGNEYWGGLYQMPRRFFMRAIHRLAWID